MNDLGFRIANLCDFHLFATRIGRENLVPNSIVTTRDSRVMIGVGHA